MFRITNAAFNAIKDYFKSRSEDNVNSQDLNGNIFISDDELKNGLIIPDDVEAKPSKEIFFYAVNRILLHAMITKFSEWTDEFDQAFRVVARHLYRQMQNPENEIFPNQFYSKELMILISIIHSLGARDIILQQKVSDVEDYFRDYFEGEELPHLCVLLKIIPEKKIKGYLNYVGPEFIRNMIGDDVELCLDALQSSDRRWFLVSFLGVEFIKEHFNSSYYLGKCLEKLDPKDQCWLLENVLGVEFLQSQIKYTYQLKYCLQGLTEENQPWFLNILGENFLRRFFNRVLSEAPNQLIQELFAENQVANRAALAIMGITFNFGQPTTHTVPARAADIDAGHTLRMR